MRRLFACVLALVVVGEASGVARAMGRGARVRCCCGSHASARPCRCPSCPTTRVRARSFDPTDGHLCAARDCDGDGAADPGVLRVLATPAAAPPAPAAPCPPRRLALAAPLPLRGRLLDAARPPP